MKQAVQNEAVRTETIYMPAPPHHHPPHERNDMVHIEFDDNDFDTLSAILNDPDSVNASENIVIKSPPEVRILAFQTMQIINRLGHILEQNRKEN